MASYRSVVRRTLYSGLQETAEWREEKASQHPDDPRNARSADALRAASRWVVGINLKKPLPSGFTEYRKADALSSYWGTTTSRVASQFFFDRKSNEPTPEDFNKLLKQLAVALKEDAAAEMLGIDDALGFAPPTEQKVERTEPRTEGLDGILVARFDDVVLTQRLDAIEQKLDRVLELLA